MHKALHRQPHAMFFAAALLLGLNEVHGADASLQADQELAAAAATSALLRARQTSPKEWQKLEQIYKELTTKYPEDARVLNAYGKLLWERGRMEEAERVFEQARALAPENADTLSALGTAALASGEVRKAAAMYSKACKAAPTSAPRHFDLANVLFLFRHELLDPSAPDIDSVIAQAMKHYAEACRLAPENVDFARGYAETFYGTAKPDWKAALEAWRHLHRISPTKDFALANMATVHLKLGQKDEARECVRQMNSTEFAARKARLAERIEKE